MCVLLVVRGAVLRSRLWGAEIAGGSVCRNGGHCAIDSFGLSPSIPECDTPGWPCRATSLLSLPCRKGGLRHPVASRRMVRHTVELCMVKPESAAGAAIARVKRRTRAPCGNRPTHGQVEALWNRPTIIAAHPAQADRSSSGESSAPRCQAPLARNSSRLRIFSAESAASNRKTRRACSPTGYRCCGVKISPACSLLKASQSRWRR